MSEDQSECRCILERNEPQEVASYIADTSTEALSRPDIYGKTALHYAIELRSDNMIRRLCERLQPNGNNHQCVGKLRLADVRSAREAISELYYNDVRDAVLSERARDRELQLDEDDVQGLALQFRDQRGLPLEIVAQIFRMADMCKMAEFVKQPEAGVEWVEEHSRGGENEDLPGRYTLQVLGPVDKIEFRITSHDQGWASSECGGRYRPSHTWFEARIRRQRPEDPNSPSFSQPLVIGRNVCASMDFRTHYYEWKCERGSPWEEYAEMREGDKIEVEAKALYPGWCNYVREVKIVAWTPIEVVSSAPTVA